MPLYDFFKSLFGIPNSRNDHFPQRENPEDYHEGRNDEQYENKWRDSQQNDDICPDDPQSFNIFTNPLEMQRYFEYQMNEMLKSFGGAFSAFGDMPALGPSPEGPPQLEPPTGNLRDQLLKPGYETTKENNLTEKPKTDLDLDGKVNLGDLDILLKDKSSGKLTPYQENRSFTPQIRSFGQSMSSKTIRKPDGTIETHKTIRDSSGAEETIVTRQRGDKQYTLTIRTDKDGKQERTEDMVNINDHERSTFTDNWSRKPPEEPNPNNLFPFDKFFK